MSVEVIHESADWKDEPAENCCMCYGKTRTWYKPKDVALCLDCAEFANAEEIPNKTQWFENITKRQQATIRKYNLERLIGSQDTPIADAAISREKDTK